MNRIQLQEYIDNIEKNILGSIILKYVNIKINKIEHKSQLDLYSTKLLKDTYIKNISRVVKCMNNYLKPHLKFKNNFIKYKFILSLIKIKILSLKF